MPKAGWLVNSDARLSDRKILRRELKILVHLYARARTRTRTNQFGAAAQQLTYKSSLSQYAYRFSCSYLSTKSNTMLRYLAQQYPLRESIRKNLDPLDYSHFLRACDEDYTQRDIHESLNPLSFLFRDPSLFTNWDKLDGTLILAGRDIDHINRYLRGDPDSWRDTYHLLLLVVYPNQKRIMQHFHRIIRGETWDAFDIITQSVGDHVEILDMEISTRRTKSTSPKVLISMCLGPVSSGPVLIGGAIASRIWSGGHIPYLVSGRPGCRIDWTESLPDKDHNRRQRNCKMKAIIAFGESETSKVVFDYS